MTDFLLLFIGYAITAIVVILFGICIYIGVIIPRRRINAANRSADICAQATLSEKATEVRTYGHGSTTVHLFIFDIYNGTRKMFMVKPEVYYNHAEGEEGILTYKELNDTRVFVSFQRTK